MLELPPTRRWLAVERSALRAARIARARDRLDPSTSEDLARDAMTIAADSDFAALRRADARAPLDAWMCITVQHLIRRSQHRDGKERSNMHTDAATAPRRALRRRIDHLTEAWKTAMTLLLLPATIADARPDDAVQPIRDFASGVLELRRDASFDLDSVAPDAGTSGTVEIEHKPAELIFRTSRTRADDMAGLLEDDESASWWRSTTSDGRVAWVQVLRGPPGRSIAQVRDYPVVLRWVVARRGAGAPTRQIRDAFCLGRGDSIEVHFGQVPSGASVLIERRDGPEAPFRVVGSATSSPYVDRSVAAGIRYGYRLTVRSGASTESLPRETAGMTDSSGVRRGSVDVYYDVAPLANQVDLVRGIASTTPSDVKYVSLAGGRARFVRSDGLAVIFDHRVRFGAFARCDPDANSLEQDIPQSSTLLVPIAGGGISRVRFTRTPARLGARLEYETSLDGATLPAPPSLRVEPRGEGSVRLTIGIPPGGRIAKLTERRLDRPDASPRELPAPSCESFELPCSRGSVLLFGVICSDRYGRLGVQATEALDLRGESPIEGEFELRVSQGFSFASLGVVSPGDADVVFSEDSGAGATVELLAACGLTNLESATSAEQTGTRDQIYKSVVGVDPSAIELRVTADGDSRNPSSDVFVIRTSTGGWAKLVIDARVRGQPGAPSIARGRYVLVPNGRQFVPDGRVIRRPKGVLLGG